MWRAFSVVGKHVVFAVTEDGTAHGETFKSLDVDGFARREFVAVAGSDVAVLFRMRVVFHFGFRSIGIGKFFVDVGETDVGEHRRVGNHFDFFRVRMPVGRCREVERVFARGEFFEYEHAIIFFVGRVGCYFLPVFHQSHCKFVERSISVHRSCLVGIKVVFERMQCVFHRTHDVAGGLCRAIEPSADGASVAHAFLAAIVDVEQAVAFRMVGVEATFDEVAVGSVAKHAVVAGVAHRCQGAAHERYVAAHVRVVFARVVRLVGDAVIVDVRPSGKSHVFRIDQAVAHCIVGAAVEH